MFRSSTGAYPSPIQWAPWALFLRVPHSAEVKSEGNCISSPNTSSWRAGAPLLLLNIKMVIKLKENEMGWACSSHASEEKCLQKFWHEIWREETVWERQAWVGDWCYNGTEGHIMWDCGLDACGLGEGLVLGHYEHSNEMWECGLDASGLGVGLVLGHCEHSNEIWEWTGCMWIRSGASVGPLWTQ